MTAKIHSLPKITPGSYISFELSPTITALSPSFSAARSTEPVTLESNNILANLSYDLSRNLRDNYSTLADLSRLSTLGALPISFIAPSTIRVYFPGCDAETVESLCVDVGVRRGVIVQDEAFDRQPAVEMALLYPFASSKEPTPQTSPGDHYLYHRDGKHRHAAPQLDWQDLLTPSPEFSPESNLTGLTTDDELYFEQQRQQHFTGREPGCSSPEINQFSSVSSSVSEAGMFFQPLDDIAPILVRPAAPPAPPAPMSSSNSENFAVPAPATADNVQDFEGVQGIYQFLEECDTYQR